MTMSETEERPFDPEVLKRFDELAAYQDSLAEDEKDESFAVFEIFVRGEWLAITIGDLLEMRARVAFGAKAGEQLAEKCAAYRAERNEARAAAKALVAWARAAWVADEDLASVLSCTVDELPAWLAREEDDATESAGE